MKVSVIIPNYNGRKLLEHNLPSVIKACPGCEIIVVDDASTDDSVEYLHTNFPLVKIIKNKTNLRFARTCNKGAKKASGDLLLFLNSDVSPQSDFLKPLLNHFQNNHPLDKVGSLKAGRFNDKIFSVGCKEIEIKDDRQVFSGRTEGEIKKGLLIHWRPKDQKSFSTLWNFGGSMLVDRSKFIALGGFDPVYSPAYWEDIDLSWQAKKHGWQVLFEKDSIVHHNHESTNDSVFGQDKIRNISLRNQIIFSLKHFPLQFYLWLPYHLLITNFRTRGLFATSLTKALQKYYFKK